MILKSMIVAQTHASLCQKTRKGERDHTVHLKKQWETNKSISQLEYVFMPALSI